MIKFLIKGLMRDRSRSLFPVVIVAAGVFITVLMYSFINGVMSDMLNSNAKFDTGHVKVITKAYREIADQVPNDLALMDVNQVIERLEKERSDMFWAPRIRFGGLLDIPDKNGETKVQGPVFGMGVNIFGKDSRETDILNLKASIVEGKLPAAKNEILLSSQFAKKLGVKPGDAATLVSSTMYGSMVIYNFKIAGTVEFGIAVLDKGSMIADISDVRNALDMDNAASEIVGFTDKMDYNDEDMLALTSKTNNGIFKSADEFSPVMMALRENGDMGMFIDLIGYFSAIIVGLFVFVMSVVLWNSGLMNGIRRYGEIGIRLAMGENKGTVYRRMILESFFLGLAGSILGTALGLGLSYLLQYHPVDFTGTGKLQQSNVIMSNKIRAVVNGTSYIVGFFPGIIASVLGTIAAGIGIYRRKTSQLFKELEV